MTGFYKIMGECLTRCSVALPGSGLCWRFRLEHVAQVPRTLGSSAVLRPELAARSLCYDLSRYGFSSHHHNGGSFFSAGQTWLSVSPSNSSPSFMT